MLARRGCATRICLSCRFALTRQEVVARASPGSSRFYQSNLGQRQFSSSFGLRNTSSNAPDTTREGQEPLPTDDPFALLKANRRHEPTQPKTKARPRRKTKAKTKLGDNIDAREDFFADEQEVSLAETPKPKSKRNSKPKAKARPQVVEDDTASAPAHDPFAALKSDRRLDKPERPSIHKHNKNNLPATTQGEEEVKQTEHLAESSSDSVLPAGSQSTTEIHNSSPISESIAVDETSYDFDKSELGQVEGQQTSLGATIDNSYAEYSTMQEGTGGMGDLHDRPAKQSTRTTQRRSAKQDLQHRQIGIDALGQPGAAIILDNPDMLSRKRSGPLNLPLEDEASLDIDLELLKPRETPEFEQTFSDEAMANIDELNLRGVGVLSEKELFRYRDTLAGSFTMKQLDAYVQAFAKSNDPSPTLELRGKGFKSITEFTTEWTPNSSGISPSMTKKQQLAFQVITRAWDVEISGSANLGSMQLKLNSDLYAVLAQPTTGALNFAKARLDESAGESIAFDLTGPSIDVRCRKESLRNVLNRLETLHGAIKVIRPPTHGVPEEHISWPEFHDEIARITGTAIGLENDRVAVRWMEYHQPGVTSQPALTGIPIENKGDVALRLLRGQDYHPGLSVVTAIQMDVSTDLKKCTHIPHLANMRSMSLTDKLRPWTRWTAPTSKPESAPSPRQYPISTEVEFPKVNQRSESKVAHTQLFSASFGHVLHSSPRDPAMKGLGADRILAPTTPHPAAFNKLMSEDHVTRAAFILLKFSPAVKKQKQKKTKRDSDPPAVHLTLPVNPDSDFSNFAMPADALLYAERPGFRCDVLIPESPVDVRLDVRDRLPLDMANQPALLQFFESSEFNLAEGQLLTPPNVEFLLPATWPIKGKKEEWSTEAYHFAGLEVHQAISVEWQAQVLRYSSIEAGQQGGRRQQLTLECECTPGTDLATRADQHKAFLEAVDGVALGRAFPWTDGHKLIVEEEEIVDDLPGNVEGKEALESVGDLAREDVSVAAFTHEQLSDQIASAAEKVQQLTTAVQDVFRPQSDTTTMNDTDPTPGEELWVSIAAEEYEAAIVEADELMETVEDALTSFVGVEPGEDATEEGEIALANEDQASPVTSEARQTAIERDHERASPVNGSPAPAAETHDAATIDQTRDDADHTTVTLLAETHSSNLSPLTEDMITPTPKTTGRVEGVSQATDETPGQAPSPPENKERVVDESSPWGHAWSLFR